METEKPTPNEQDDEQEIEEAQITPPLEEQPMEEPAEDIAEDEQEAELAQEPEPAAFEESDEAPFPPVETEEEADSKPSWINRWLHFLFSQDSRVGRFMRPFLRTAALIVGMFGIGFLVAYFTIYIPLNRQRDELIQQVSSVNQELEETSTALDDKESELAALQDSSKSAIDDLEEQVEEANFRVAFLIAKNDTLRARIALLDDEEGPGGPEALAALNELEEHLDDLLPYVEEVDPVLAGLLEDRLKVVKGELVRDGDQAKLELDSFYTNLLELEDTLFN